MRGAHLCAFFDQKFAQNGAMAMRFVFAIAADGEICVMRKRGEEFDGVGGLGRGHFGPVLFDKSVPLSRRFGGEGQFHGRKAWREVWEPHVVPVL